MKSQEYWRKREQDNIKRLLKNDINYQKEIERIYAENLRNVESRIDSLYRRYSDKNGEISLADVKAIADKTDVASLAETARKMSQDKDFSQYANDLLAKYNLKMEVSRLELLKDEINLELIKNGVNVDKYVADKLTDETKAELKRQAGILGNSLDVTDTKLIKGIVNGSFGSSTFSERLWGNTQYLANSLDTLLTQSIINGRHPNDVARELRRQFDISQKQAERLMRTESARVHAECAVKSMEKNGVTQYEWVSEPSACKICGPLDGKIFEVKGAEFGNVKHPMFPLHPNCRCAVIAVVDKTADEKSDKTDDNSLDKVYNEDRDIKSIKKHMESIDISTASHEDLISLGSLVNSKFDVASKLGDKQELKNIFSNFREIGGTVPKDGWAKGSSKENKTRLDETFAFYPKEWAEYAHQNGKTIYTKKMDRGFFSEIGIKGKTWKSGVVDNGVSIMLSDRKTVSFHEIGHYVEHFNPNALKLSKEFLAYRTKGEEEEPIRNTIYYYNARERTKKDNFITPYIGKTYSNATEVLSVGLESLFEPGMGQIFSQERIISKAVRKKISDDPEYLNFVIGMILKG